MHIPFPCPKNLSEMKKSGTGFYCGDCNKHLIDTTNPNSTEPQKGDCIITDVPHKKHESLNRTYRFALALFIVMSASLIVNKDVFSNQLIGQLNLIKDSFLKYNSAHTVQGQLSDTKGRPIKPVKIIVTLEDGEKIEDVYYSSYYGNSDYQFQLDERYLNTKIVITFEYFGETKKIEVLFEGNETEIPKVEFKRNWKDRYNKKRFRKYRFVGKF